MNNERVLARAYEQAIAYLRGVNERPVARPEAAAPVLNGASAALPDDPQDPLQVIDDLVAALDPGLVAGAGPRYFGFVTGGALPAAVAADWLVSTWDQNVALHVMSPAMAAVEETAARWILEILDLPRDASVGFTTGAHSANVVGLASARHEVLRHHGWDVEARGLHGAPEVTVFAGAEAHASIFAACRLIGLGADRVVRVEADAQGRMNAASLERALVDVSGPAIVCAQAGNVNTGAFDPLDAIADAARERGAWLHVDGAFGLWAAVDPDLRRNVRGAARADSWTTDAHKWLNVPYDCGIAIVAHPAAHRAAMSMTAAYLPRGTDEQRDGSDWVIESSRRARALPVYAALRTLGRAGLADLVRRCCALARRMAERLSEAPGVTILNEVVLNQVLVRVDASGGGSVSDVTADAIARVQREGICWVGGTSWEGRPAIRISVSSWRTTDADIDRSAASLLEAIAQARG
jgi:glutamate/tyrosine decarboxylase-like PLP-dependent enzyme